MNKKFTRFVKISLLCLLAVGGNYLLNYFCVYLMKFPMYLDTVFTAAVTFAAGLIPGLVTALLSYFAFSVRDNSFFHPFIICGIAEVFILWLFRFKASEKEIPVKLLPAAASREMKITAFIRVAAKLMLIFVLCCLAVSVLGGLIDFLFYGLGSNPKLYYSAEDTFKIGLLRSGIPLLAMDILSRIAVNIVDRFIVVFGGYLISRLFVRGLRN